MTAIQIHNEGGFDATIVHLPMLPCRACGGDRIATALVYNPTGVPLEFLDDTMVKASCTTCTVCDAPAPVHPWGDVHPAGTCDPCDRGVSAICPAGGHRGDGHHTWSMCLCERGEHAACVHCHQEY